MRLTFVPLSLQLPSLSITPSLHHSFKLSYANMSDSKEQTQTFDIPKMCKGGVVVNEGPDFHVEVQDVPVPETGMCGVEGEEI
jgi:hypothetical protein